MFKPRVGVISVFMLRLFTPIIFECSPPVSCCPIQCSIVFTAECRRSLFCLNSVRFLNNRRAFLALQKSPPLDLWLLGRNWSSSIEAFCVWIPSFLCRLLLCLPTKCLILDRPSRTTFFIRHLKLIQPAYAYFIDWSSRCELVLSFTPTAPPKC